jgi:predicted AlkP superfamily pyrophosphatase or phosphodiesterase
VVLITIDQMRADYLDRFGSQLTGGLARLARGGARYTNAHHDHAITETAPGHASLLSGRFPRSTGITSNYTGVDDDESALVGGASGPGASPHRFRGTTLVDWLRERDPRSRALAVSAKDRSAILPVGRSRQHVYWYVPDGRFTTSRWYADSLPAWVVGFNDRDLARRRAGQLWTPALPDAAYHAPDSVADEAGGRGVTFPHAVPADSGAAASYVRATPWIDELVLDFARDGVRALALGRGPSVDVLSVSLSGTDFIGHLYGPDSREMHDQIVRLDRSLGTFLDSLYATRDSARVAVVLTADHGVGSIPELAAVTPAPVRVDLGPALARTREALRRARVDSSALREHGEAFSLDRAAFARARRDPEPLLARLIAEVRSTPGVLRADRWRDLLAADPGADAIARRWTHQFPATAAIDVVVTLTPGSVWGASVATHGSPHDYDSHVPLVFYGPMFRAGRYGEFVRTVDLAPTLAAVAGVRPLEPLDGAVLGRALRVQAPAAAR